MSAILLVCRKFCPASNSCSSLNFDWISVGKCKMDGGFVDPAVEQLVVEWALDEAAFNYDRDMVAVLEQVLQTEVQDETIRQRLKLMELRRIATEPAALVSQREQGRELLWELSPANDKAAQQLQARFELQVQIQNFRERPTRMSRMQKVGREGQKSFPSVLTQDEYQEVES
eukprot:g56700.t1